MQNDTTGSTGYTWNQHLIRITAAVTIALMLIGFALYIIRWPTLTAQAALLDKDLMGLPMPPSTVSTGPTNASSLKPGMVTVYRSFKSTLSDSEIDQFYLPEILKRGWVPYNNRVYDEGRSVQFCKGNNYALSILHNYGELAKRWSYSIYMVWTPTGCIPSA